MEQRRCPQCLIPALERWHGAQSREVRDALAQMPECCRHQTSVVSSASGSAMSELSSAISSLTDKVVAVRVLRERGVDVAELPKIEIRGMGDTVRRAREQIQRSREAFASLNDEVAGLVEDAERVTEQVRAHREDLRSEAMGNGSGSGKTEG